MLILSGFLFLALSLCAHAASATSVRFTHDDWELACDSTRTCRAAGYSGVYFDAMSMSVLFTRKAGVSQPVTGQLMVDHSGKDDAFIKLPKKFKLTIRIEDKSVGQVELRQDSLVADLTTRQVAALLAALPKAGDIAIECSAGDLVWQLSDQGAAAVLLKMDEAQGRVGTRGALIKRGPRSDSTALPPLSLPVVFAAEIAEPRTGDAQIVGKHAKALRNALRATLKSDSDCYKLTKPESGKPGFSINRLSERKFLVSTPCWSGPYNFGEGYWVIDGAPPFQPILVTLDGTDYLGGKIYSSQWGAGQGNCWSLDNWVWGGIDFVHTASSSSGMCRLREPGGYWELPTLVTDVRPAEHK